MIETFSLILRRDFRLCCKIKNQFSLLSWQNFSLRLMATLSNKRKLAAVSRETPNNTRNTQSQNTLHPGMAQEYISQVSEEIERRFSKILSEEFSRTESRVLGTLSKLDEFLLNPQVRTCSVAVPGTSRNGDSDNREPTGDRSLKDPCPETMFCSHHSGNLDGSELEESHHMVTGVQEDIPYRSPGTASGKQKKARSTSQPRFRNKNTPARIEADQILLALQQLTENSNSANFNNNINRILKLPKSLTTAMPTFDGKSELFAELFQTSLKTHNQLTVEDKKLLVLSHAWWCATNIQKHHQPQQRDFERNSCGVP